MSSSDPEVFELHEIPGARRAFTASAPGGDGSRSFESLRDLRARQAEEQGEQQLAVQRQEIERARATGAAEGRAAAEVELAAPLAHALAELAILRGAYLEQNRRSVVELAVAIAERIVRTHLAGSADALSSFLEHVFATAADASDAGAPGSAGRLCVAIAPADRDLLASLGDASPLAAAGVEVEIDEGLQRGDLIVRSNQSEVDARTESLLAVVREAVLPAISAPAGESTSEAAAIAAAAPPSPAASSGNDSGGSA